MVVEHVHTVSEFVTDSFNISKWVGNKLIKIMAHGSKTIVEMLTEKKKKHAHIPLHLKSLFNKSNRTFRCTYNSNKEQTTKSEL